MKWLVFPPVLNCSLVNILELRSQDRQEGITIFCFSLSFLGLYSQWSRHPQASCMNEQWLPAGIRRGTKTIHRVTGWPPAPAVPGPVRGFGDTSVQSKLRELAFWQEAQIRKGYIITKLRVRLLMSPWEHHKSAVTLGKLQFTNLQFSCYKNEDKVSSLGTLPFKSAQGTED